MVHPLTIYSCTMPAYPRHFTSWQPQQLHAHSLCIMQVYSYANCDWAARLLGFPRSQLCASHEGLERRLTHPVLQSPDGALINTRLLCSETETAYYLQWDAPCHMQVLLLCTFGGFAQSRSCEMML